MTVFKEVWKADDFPMEEMPDMEWDKSKQLKPLKMKKYKILQNIVVTITTSTAVARVIKAGTIIYEQTNGYYYREQKTMNPSISFLKEEVENTPELFELVKEEQA